MSTGDRSGPRATPDRGGREIRGVGATNRHARALAERRNGARWRADRELVEHALDGDRAALDSLVERMVCIPRILDALDLQHGFALGEAALDEAAQVARTRVVRDLASFEGSSTLETWFHGYAYNAYREARRDRSRDAAWLVSFDQVDWDDAQELETAPPADVRPEARDEVAWLYDALETMGTLNREIVELHLVDGLSFSALALRFTMTSVAVKARYYRTLEEIRARARQRDARWDAPRAQGGIAR